MGGNLAVTLRLEDGTVYKMDRWTNSFPDFINNMKFIEKDPAHIKGYLAPWLEMKEDWETNGPNGPFQHDMTSVYFPHFEMAPSEYGLVVIDMQTNKIYSQQGYSTPGKGYRNTRSRYPDEDDIKRIAALEEKGRVTVTYDEGDGFQDLQFDLSPFDIIHFKQGKEETLRYMSLLDEIYGLSEKEKAVWQQYIVEHYEEEEE